MEDIILWVMDKYPQKFHKVDYDTVKMMLDLSHGDASLVKRTLSTMFSKNAI